MINRVMCSFFERYTFLKSKKNSFRKIYSGRSLFYRLFDLCGRDFRQLATLMILQRTILAGIWLTGMVAMGGGDIFPSDLSWLVGREQVPHGNGLFGRYFPPKEREREEEKSSVKLLQSNFRNLGKIIDDFELDTHC